MVFINNPDIWSLVPIIKTSRPWIQLAETCLHVLDICTSKRIYHQVIGDLGMVLTLEDIEWIDDRNLIAGHVAAITGNITLAQDFFLRSTNPKAIVDLRRDLMHWEQALNLAKTLAPDQVTFIAKEHAHQLEFDGMYAEASAMYQKALETTSQYLGPEEEILEHEISCSAGLARMTCRMGDISKGMKMLIGCSDKQLLIDCGAILDSLKQHQEAASLFERAEKYEKAADCLMKAKNWTRVGTLIKLVSNPKLIIQYAKNRESEKLYADSAAFYERAGDYENLVRVYIDHLKNIDSAVSIVRKFNDRNAAKLVSRFFIGIKDYKSVVEFYIMAGMADEALEIATVFFFNLVA